MARHFASFDVVKDTPVSLETIADDVGRYIDLPLQLPDDRNSGMQSVLSYMVDPGSSGATFKMFILNPGETVLVVGPASLASHESYARQEVINPDVLTNASHLRISVTAGSAKFSDIVLMYNRAV